MTDDLSDDEGQMKMERGGGSDDEDDLDAQLNPARGGGGVHQRRNTDGRPKGSGHKTTAKTSTATTSAV